MDIQHVFFCPSKIDSKDHLNRLPAIYFRVEICPLEKGVTDQSSCIMCRSQNYFCISHSAEWTVKVFYALYAAVRQDGEKVSHCWKLRSLFFLFVVLLLVLYN